MFQRLIQFFVRNHLFTNFFFLIILVGGVNAWLQTNKEDLPNIEFDFLRVSTAYSGASAKDVEHFVTKPIEEAIKGVDGINSIRSTSSSSSSSVVVELDMNLEDKTETVNEIKSAVQSVSLPSEVRNAPRIRQFKTSQRSILDIALINPKAHLLSKEERKELQQYALALENQLTSLKEVSSVRKSGYLKEEININLLPEKLKHYNISIKQIQNKLSSYNLQQPIGNLENRNESKVVIADTDYNINLLKDFTLRGSYQQPEVKLDQVAQISRNYHKKLEIIKVNGREAVVINVTKSSSSGIITAIEKVNQVIKSFENNNLLDAPIKMVVLDDESEEVKNRLTLISNNGLIGFVLILILLFIFLDFRSGFWVAMGIPFTFCFTMLVIHYLGFTINNITLAGVIIVMGMIVDDAIVVAENIIRTRNNGMPLSKAVIEGTVKMFLPVSASVVTTCVAFLPLFNMDGRFAQMVFYIPAIVIIMLIASLLESLFLLPAHMKYDPPRWFKIASTFGLYLWVKKKRLQKRHLQNLPGKTENQVSNVQKKGQEDDFELKEIRNDWFLKIENIYSRLLQKSLRLRYLILLIFLGLIIWSGRQFMTELKFVMFPNEETTSVNFRAFAPEGTKRIETADLSRQIDDVLAPYVGNEVVGYRTSIARSRWGRLSSENELTMKVEVVPFEKRTKPLSTLIEEWNTGFETITNLTINVSKHRFGRSSGSSIMVSILDNNDNTRNQVVDEIYNTMKNDPDLYNVSSEKTPTQIGFQININKNFSELLDTDRRQIVSTLRTILSGTVLEEIPSGDETIDLNLTVDDSYKKNIDQILNIPVESAKGMMIPLSSYVSFQSTPIPDSINREFYKRITHVVADNENLKKVKGKKAKGENGKQRDNQNNKSTNERDERKTRDSEDTKEVKTPLQIAEKYETEIFPKILSKFPTTQIYFDGEVKESRESQGQFKTSVIMVALFIYMILALLYNSLTKPILIMSVIPFGVVGVVLAYYFHGITNYGFFSLLGFLGLSGVVVNDTIVMLVKLEDYKGYTRDNLRSSIAEIAKTRVKAIFLTTFTTIAGLFPTVYGFAGYDSLLADMMFAMGWGLLFATFITLLLLPILYYIYRDVQFAFENWFTKERH